MDLRMQVVIVLATAILTILVMVFRRLERKALLEQVMRLSPNQFDSWAANIVSKAYDAVEQLAEVYEGMSSEEKQKLAVKLIQSMYKTWIGLTVSGSAATTLLEAFIFNLDDD